MIKKAWLLSLALVSSGMSSSPLKQIKHETYNLDRSVIHTLLIPPQSQSQVTLAISPKLDTIENFAQKYQAIALLNGGFFDPKNQKTTSHVVIQGKQVGDPRQNERLVNNPALIRLMNKIFNRTEFRRYLCGSIVRYDIVLHQEPPPTGCQLVNALGGGPKLLPEMTSVQEGFVEVEGGKVIRDALSSSQPNARSAIGITHNGSLMWFMVAQKPNTATSGMSLPELAAFMKNLGVEKAMNLDGGSSSSFYYQGQTFYGKVDQQGNPVKRPIKSVLLLQK